VTWVLLIRGIQADEHRVVELRERVREVLEDTPFEGTVTLDEALFNAVTRPLENELELVSHREWYRLHRRSEGQP